MQADVLSPLYEPINAYKPFAPLIGFADGPFEYVVLAGINMPLAFTTRMTIVQLANGDLFLHSPIAFDSALAEQLRSMGTVRHLVSPNRGHYAHIGEWARVFPHAITWASPGVQERARSVGIDVRFERDLHLDAPAEWRDEMDQAVIPGAVLDEVVFFHRSSKTLIVADTIMNFERERVKQPLRLIARLANMTYPLGGMSPDMRIALWPNKRRVRPAIEKVLAWQPERIILSHGRCFDKDASCVICRAFSWAL
jgi:hypothetical protein